MLCIQFSLVHAIHLLCSTCSGVQLCPAAVSLHVVGEGGGKESSCGLHLCQDQDRHCSWCWGSHTCLLRGGRYCGTVTLVVSMLNSQTAIIDNPIIFMRNHCITPMYWVSCINDIPQQYHTTTYQGRRLVRPYVGLWDGKKMLDGYS